MRTGSLHNMLADQSGDAARPEVGVGATVISWSDRYAGTIIAVSPSGHRVTWQRDTATRTDGLGMTDAQSYRYEQNEQGETREFTRRKDGAYRAKNGQARLLIGVRNEYYDFSF